MLISTVGRVSIIQNAITSIIGTSNIINNVVRESIPKARKPAYETAPITPAPPVPDDHVDTTFLAMALKKVTYLLYRNTKIYAIIYLLKNDV